MIIVTGATGHLGHAIAEKLVDRVPASQVGASVRDPGKAADLEAIGVRVRQGDFDDPESLRHASEGATQVLIVSSNARASGGNPLAQHRSAIEAARAVGARRTVYTSHMAASPSSAFPPGARPRRDRGHAASVRAGVDRASLRLLRGERHDADGRCPEYGRDRGAGGRQGCMDGA